jgi:hypothetical protein
MIPTTQFLKINSEQTLQLETAPDYYELRIGNESHGAVISNECRANMDRVQLEHLAEMINDALNSDDRYVSISEETLKSLQEKARIVNAVSVILHKELPEWQMGEGSLEQKMASTVEALAKDHHVLDKERRDNPQRNRDAELYRHMLGVAHALGYASLTQAIAAPLWFNTDEHKPVEGTHVICDDGFTPYVAYMVYEKGEEWRHEGETVNRPSKWMNFPPSNSKYTEDLTATEEAVTPSEIGTFVNHLMLNNRRNPARVALRCLEEMVELCLALGNHASSIHGAVADSIFNQALKLKTQDTTVFPSQLSFAVVDEEVNKELADVSLTFADLRFVLNRPESVIAKYGREKFNRLVATPRSQIAVTGDTFYLKKAHVGSDTPATQLSTVSEDERQAIRLRALEEAADLCDEPYRTENGFGLTAGDQRCAALIRGLLKSFK